MSVYDLHSPPQSHNCHEGQYVLSYADLLGGRGQVSFTFSTEIGQEGITRE